MALLDGEAKMKKCSVIRSETPYERHRTQPTFKNNIGYRCFSWFISMQSFRTASGGKNI